MSCGDNDHNLAARAKKCAGARSTTQQKWFTLISLSRCRYCLAYYYSALNAVCFYFFIWWERAERIWVFVAFLLCQRPLDQWSATTFVDREQHTRRRGECKIKKRSKINASGTQTNWWNELFAKVTIETRKEHKKKKQKKKKKLLLCILESTAFVWRKWLENVGVCVCVLGRLIGWCGDNCQIWFLLHKQILIGWINSKPKNGNVPLVDLV